MEWIMTAIENPTSLFPYPYKDYLRWLFFSLNDGGIKGMINDYIKACLCRVRTAHQPFSLAL